MDYDVTNSTRLRVRDLHGKQYGPFYGGLLNQFEHSQNPQGPSSLELLGATEVHAYMSLSNYNHMFLCYPLTSLKTDYVIVSAAETVISTIYVTSNEPNTEVLIFFHRNYVLNEVTYNFNSPLRIVLDDLETYVITFSEFDPSGTYVKSTKPVSVMMELVSTCYSLFYLPPVTSWGLRFSLAISAGSFYKYRIIAAYDETDVTFESSSELCSFEDEITLDAWETVDLTSEISNCSIDIFTNHPIAILLTERSLRNGCRTMVVPSTNKAMPGKVPVFVRSNESEPNIRIWISDGDYESLLVDNDNVLWNVLNTGDNEYAVVESAISAGYHVISSSNEVSRFLVTLNKELFAAHLVGEGLYDSVSVCPFRYFKSNNLRSNKMTVRNYLIF